MAPEQTFDDLSKINKGLYEKVFVAARKGFRKGRSEATKSVLENTSIKSEQFESLGVLMAFRDADRAVDLENSLVEITHEKIPITSGEEPKLLMSKEVAEFYGLIKPKRRTDYAWAIQHLNKTIKGTGLPEFTLDPSARETSKYKNDGKVGLKP